MWGAVRWLYGLYAWSLFLLLGLLTLAALILLPSLGARRAVARVLARAVLRMIGMRLQCRGLEDLPLPCVVVANHTSYLDGVLVCAALPARFSFVIKREMSAVPLAGLLLRRIGAEFVERHDRQRGARDARRLLREAGRGQALVFFPEGTFSDQVGLLRFHTGAFAAAERAGLPVVPLAIRGARHCLPPDSVWPQVGTIRIEALAVLPPVPSSAHAERGERVALLRDQARRALLTALGEPDLQDAPSVGSTSHE